MGLLNVRNQRRDGQPRRTFLGGTAGLLFALIVVLILIVVLMRMA